MKLQQLRPTVLARQAPTGHASYSKTIRTLTPLKTLTHNSSRTYELSISIPPSWEIPTTSESLQSANTTCQGRAGTPSPHLQTQQRVKNPGHAWLDRKNALAAGLGQIIFTLDVYRCTTWTSYLIKSRVALDPPPYPTCPQLPRGSTRSPVPGSLFAARIPRAPQFGSIAPESTESFTCFPSCPNFPRTLHCAECKHARSSTPRQSLQTPEITRKRLAFSPGMNCSQQRLWNWCIAVYFYTSSEQLHTQSCINSILSPASGSSPWYSEI